MGTGLNRKGWLRRLLGGGQKAPLDPDRSDLVVVVSCFDDVEGCGATLDRAAEEDPRWVSDEEAVLRHHLTLPASAVQEAVSIAAQEGYRPSDEVAGESGPDDSGEDVRLVLQRVQLLDALHCSQERSRMVGLAQRLGGSVSGWDAMQPPDLPGG
ncbi:hypothetical protein BFN03_09855 [Rhodococcus sp. WMMA185]|uniref:hypothetical protein n=1 Tax=Rhodococcus sp. WMMA185 TaxID=679318 RepID=UPI00087888B6|nr:hypothetical protein [Rhodococcus sp. WMMA185]AOW92883.1 hypothetical protein BFN03_09855 [Rhodococcus sp. WMMA185]